MTLPSEYGEDPEVDWDEFEFQEEFSTSLRSPQGFLNLLKSKAVETIESLEQHLVETLEDNSYSSESAKFLGGQIAVLLSNPPKVNKALLTQLRLECLVPSKIVQKLMLENFDREGVYHSDRVRKVGNGSNKCSFFAESEFESPLGVSFLAQAESDTKED